MYSVALSGLSFVNTLVPGVLPFGQAQAEFTPVCNLSRLDFVDLWFGAFPRKAIKKNRLSTFMLYTLRIVVVK